LEGPWYRVGSAPAERMESQCGNIGLLIISYGTNNLTIKIMGKLLQGPFGTTTGKVGKTVSYSINGQNVIRQIGVSTKKPTEKQLASRLRFKVINRLLRPINGFINLGFMFETIGTTKNQHNVATSNNMRYALKGSYPDIEVDYSKVIVSKGKLPIAQTATAIVTESDITVSWEYDKKLDFSLRNDRLMALFFYPKTNSAIYFLSGAERSAGAQVFDIPAYESEGNPEIYVSFFAEDRLTVSDSIWVNY
jgi:hypothetical protein